MSDKTTSKPMAMLLQDPSLLNDKEEYLHEDYLFPLVKDFLDGVGSSKFIVRDPPKAGQLGLERLCNRVNLRGL